MCIYVHSYICIYINIHIRTRKSLAAAQWYRASKKTFSQPGARAAQLSAHLRILECIH